jgi:hypothetical protein
MSPRAWQGAEPRCIPGIVAGRLNMDSMNPLRERRRFRITIRVTPKELAAIDGAAKRSGITVSAYARRVILGAKPLRAARRPSVEASLLVRVLDQLGRIVHQVATFNLPAPKLGTTERDLSRCLTELRALRPLLLRALGKRPTAS